MNDKTLLALYGLKYNPFVPALPVDALWPLPGAELFARRLESMVYQGGFSLVTGEPGHGKSKTLQWLGARLGQLPDIVVGVMERPQSKVADFYRELGDLFGVQLNAANRYGGFKALRARWRAHCEATLLRPLLLIDEAQEVSTECLTELRLLQSASLDSQSLLFTVLCGDGRLPHRFRTPELLPLGSRIRARLELSGLTPQDLASYLDFVLQKAGAPQLIAPELIQTLATHAHGNLRVLTHMAAELLTAAAERNLPRIDEPLYFDLFTPPARQSRRS
jgi:type II secretory pathway predicted ATPase ExeA